MLVGKISMAYLRLDLTILPPSEGFASCSLLLMDFSHSYILLNTLAEMSIVLLRIGLLSLIFT